LRPDPQPHDQRSHTQEVGKVAGVVEARREKDLGICPTMYQSYFKIIIDLHMLSAYKIEVIENIYDELSITIT